MAACPQSELDADTVKSILVNTNFIMLKWLQSDAASDGLIEALGETVYIPRMCILSEIYQISTEESAIIYKVTHYLSISAHHHWTFEDLLEDIWD